MCQPSRGVARRSDALASDMNMNVSLHRLQLWHARTTKGELGKMKHDLDSHDPHQWARASRSLGRKIKTPPLGLGPLRMDGGDVSGDQLIGAPPVHRRFADQLSKQASEMGLIRQAARARNFR